MTECTRGEIKDRLPDYVNGTLSAAAHADVEAHLASCDVCREEVVLLRGLRAAVVRRTPTVDVARISAAVRAAGAPARRTARRPRPAFVWQAAAAALIVAGAAYAGYVLRSHATPERTPTVAQQPTPSPLPSPLASPLPSPTPSPIPSRIPRPTRPVALASLSFDGVDDLTPAQAAAMMQELDQGAPTLDADPEAELALEIAS